MEGIPETLRPAALLAHPKALSAHLRSLLVADSSLENLTFINTCILDQVHSEAVPSSVYEVWLHVLLAWTCQNSTSSSWSFTTAALRDPTSRGVRFAATKVIRHRLFGGRDWARDAGLRGWDILGGAGGVKDILDELPLAEVRRLIKVIFDRCDAVPSDKMESVSKCIEELLNLVENADRWASKSLLPEVSHLAAYCGAEKVQHLLRTQPAMCFSDIHHFPRLHTPLLRRIGIGAVEMPKDVRLKILQRCRDAMLQSKEAYEPIYFNQDKEKHPVMSPGLIFGIDLLMVVQKEPSLHDYYGLEAWVNAISKKALREELPFKSILLIISHGLSALLATALARTDWSGPGWLSRPLSEAVVQLWSISRFGRVEGFPKGLVAMYRRKRRLKSLSAHQAALEQCLIQKVLQAEDQSFNAQKNHQQFTVRVRDLLSLVDRKGRLELLQMLCKYSSSLGFDLTAWPPSKKEQDSMPFWHLDILNKLPLPDSKSLFERSLYIHQCEGFLPSSDDRDSSSTIPSWEKQCLLWANWEALDPQENGFRITLKAIYETKQKSMRAREPPERRRWAEQAINLAVRTSSVEIFADIVEWSKRFIRDPLVFPDLMCEIIDSSGRLLSCRIDVNGATTPVSKSDLLQKAQTEHKILEDILQSCLLLLREPWARPSISRITRRVPGMLFTIVGDRMNLVRKRPCGESVTDSEVFEILVEPMAPILLEYERQGNMEGQTDVQWSGPSGMAVSYYLPVTPNPREMAFIDRLAKSRDEFWQQHRAQNDPDVLELSAGWPRGLPIQSLVRSQAFVHSAIKHQEYAPFIASRANQVLFGAADTVMTVVKDEEKGRIDGFVDDLDFVICAFLRDEDKSRDVLHLWKHYSQLLQPHPDYLGLFQDWLIHRMLYIGDMAEAIDTIRPPLRSPSEIRPTVSQVPTGSETIEWDPHEGDYPLSSKTVTDEEGRKTEPYRIPCTVLNCRMGGSIPSKAPLVERKMQPKPERLSIWSSKFCVLAADTQDLSRCVQDSVILAAFLFLDTYTKSPRILRRKFPDVDFPRYTPIYLADEFITFHRSRNKRQAAEALQTPIEALRSSAKRIPPHVLQELIWSFLDTLEADPKAANYSSLLFHTFELIEILLRTDKPQLAIDVVIRVWQDFANESSLHRKISLVKLGWVLTPAQGREMMRGFTRYVCEALQAQQQQPGKEEKKEKKAFIKVTTAKMLAQALAEADFLSQSDRMGMLQMMFNSARHIDIRREIAAALLELVSTCDHGNVEPYRVFATIASSVAGPNERATTTEAEWAIAETQQDGPLPYVAPVSDRPILELVVSTAVSKIPEKLRSDYVQNVLIPLLHESTRQHTRWMAAMSARLGLSVSDLGITEQEIGPFVPNLTDRILSRWIEYISGPYLQEYQRPWALGYFHYESFSRIDKALSVTIAGPLKDINVRDHWKGFFSSLIARSGLFDLKGVLLPIVKKGSKASNGLNIAHILEEFSWRVGVITRNPVKWHDSLKAYTVHPEYPLELLRALRKCRVECVSAVKDADQKAQIYNALTDAMTRALDVCEKVRIEGWSTKLIASKYPVTLPSTFDYQVLMLPSPEYNPNAAGLELAVDIFTTGVFDLIHKYSGDPILLLKLNSIESILDELHYTGFVACLLRLGSAQHQEHDTQVVTYVRIKLASLMMDRFSLSSEENIMGMIREWKNSDVEFVRQIGWELDYL